MRKRGAEVLALFHARGQRFARHAGWPGSLGRGEIDCTSSVLKENVLAF